MTRRPATLALARTTAIGEAVTGRSRSEIGPIFPHGRGRAAARSAPPGPQDGAR